MFVLITFSILLVIIIVFRFIFPFYFLSKRAKKLLEEIPGPKPIAVLGNIFEFNRDHDELLSLYLEFHKKYGHIFKYIVFGRPSVFLSHYEDVEVVLKSTIHIDKSDIYNHLHPWLGTGLLTSTGKKWHRRRKILTPTFHFNILEEYIPIINENATILIDKLKTISKNRQKIDIRSVISLCSLDIICETAMGVSVNAQKGGSEYVDSLHRISYLLNHRVFHPWLWSDFIFSLSPSGREHNKCLEVLHKFTKKVIQERRAEHLMRGSDQSNSKHGKRRLAFLDMLIEASERDGGLTDSDIREEVDTFMFEGHDTVSSAISWALYLLGFHPEIQDKAYAELMDIFGDTDRLMTWDDLQQMRYLEQIIKEALRLYPSVPVFARENTVDISIGKYIIPPGCEIIIFPHIIHRNEEVYPDPEKFNPDHFLPEKCLNRHPFAYLPFSAGPRNCIGQRFALLEEKILLSSILRNFKIQSYGKRENITILLDLILQPKEPIMINLYPRF